MLNFAHMGFAEWLAVGGVTIIALALLASVVALCCCFVMSGRRNDYQEQVVYERWRRKMAEKEGNVIDFEEWRHSGRKDAKKR